MTLKQIAEQIDLDRQIWGKKHQLELEQVSSQPDIALVIKKIIEEAIRHPRATTGRPADAVKAALGLSSLANFRLGLLIGIQLYKPVQDTPLISEAGASTLFLAAETTCDFCEGDGIHCIHCGLRRQRCTCGHLYSPVKCDCCDGTGKIGPVETPAIGAKSERD